MTQKEALRVLKMGKNVFLTGAAGSGKTYVLKQYIDFLKKYGVDVAVTASTGIAATHLKGMTIHSWSGIGIKDTLTEYDLEALEEKEYLWRRFDKTHVLIIDEISMLSSSTINCIDRVCKLFKRNEKPFGGIQVIFSGDFFQLPPIEKKKKAEYEQTIFIDTEDDAPQTPFAFNASSWKDCDLHTCYLTEQFRQNKKDDLHIILSEIRSGEVSKKSKDLLKKRMIKDSESRKVKEEVTKLYTHNVHVDGFNQKKLEAIEGSTKEYTMTTKGNPILIDSLKRGCLVPEKLILKKGALVMFVKNNPVVGYVNGTVGEIVDFDEGYPVVQDSSGEKYTAMPQTWAIEEGLKTLAELSQVPLKLAWAVTVHKSQGMTLNEAVIDLSKAFVSGQGYVALSRVKAVEGLYLEGLNDMVFSIDPEVKKVDGDLFEDSKELFEEMKKTKDVEFKKIHEVFLKKIGAKKHAVSNEKGEKLNTYEITQNLLKEKKIMEDIISVRGVKIGTIISHLEKLMEEKKIQKKDIDYLNPKTETFSEMIEEIREASKKIPDLKLTPLFNELGKKYSFEDIRFGKLFL